MFAGLFPATCSHAEAALGRNGTTPCPFLRLFDVTHEEGAVSSQVRVRDIEIHGDVDHWYLPVQHAPRSYKVQIGYRGAGSSFFMDGEIQQGANAPARITFVEIEGVEPTAIFAGCDRIEHSLREDSLL